MLVIAAIDGMAGVGKTAFVVHPAQRMADRFPDGQLFLDLHGHTEGVEPMVPVDALSRLLHTLGVPAREVPHDVDGRSALLRSTMAGRRMLIVLDNARGEPQVRPLLPGTPGCLVLITSRHRLTDLDGAHTVSLDVLPTADAVELFRRTVGADRLVGEQSELLVDVVQACGRLPLAIRIAAGRFRSRTAWTLRHLVDRLAGADRLTELHTGHRGIAAALELSYQELEPAQQRLYRLAGLHPGPDVDAYAAAALTGTAVADVTAPLDALFNAHLLTEPAAGRYRFHELVRAHAAATAKRVEPKPEIRAALARLLDLYIGVTADATATVHPQDRNDHRHSNSPRLDTPAQAAAWLHGELAGPHMRPDWP